MTVLGDCRGAEKGDRWHRMASDAHFSWTVHKETVLEQCYS